MHKLKLLFVNTLKHWRAISVVFMTQVILGLIVSVSFYSELSRQFDFSMALDQLAKGFDRTVFMDLINSNDAFLSRTKIYSVVILFIYLLAGAFLQAGWLANIRKQQFTISALLKNSLKLIAPFLGFAAISMLLVFLGGGLMALFFAIAVGDPLITFSSEKPFVLWIIGLIVLFIIWTTFIWAWSVMSRCYYIDGNSFVGSLRLGLHTIFQKWFKFQAIGMFIVAVHIIFIVLYYWIMEDRGTPSWTIVWFGIFIQQIFNYLRIILRGFSYFLVEDLV